MIARIDHVGVLVSDFPGAKRLLGDVLSFTSERSLVVPGRLEAEFYRCGDASVELIDVTDPAEHERRLGQAAGRIEHIALEVNDLAAASEYLRRTGVLFSAASPVVNGPIRSYFTRPETTSGLMFQVFEWVDGGSHR